MQTDDRVIYFMTVLPSAYLVCLFVRRAVYRITPHRIIAKTAAEKNLLAANNSLDEVRGQYKATQGALVNAKNEVQSLTEARDRLNEEIKGQYIDDLVDMVDIKKGLKVVVDCASGAGSEISPLVFRKAGCEVTTLNSQPDGFFPGRNPEPNAENLQTLMKTVVAIGADLGIAHDGDADRMITVDEKGNVSPFDSLLALISKEFEGDIVTTVDAGLCMDESVNGEVLRKSIATVMK